MLVLVLAQLVQLDNWRTVQHKPETVQVKHVRDGDVEVFPAELKRDGNEGKDDWDVVRVVSDPQRCGVSVQGASEGDGEKGGVDSVETGKRPPMRPTVRDGDELVVEPARGSALGSAAYSRKQRDPYSSPSYSVPYRTAPRTRARTRIQTRPRRCTRTRTHPPTGTRCKVPPVISEIIPDTRLRALSLQPPSTRSAALASELFVLGLCPRPELAGIGNGDIIPQLAGRWLGTVVVLILVLVAVQILVQALVLVPVLVLVVLVPRPPGTPAAAAAADGMSWSIVKPL